MKEKIIIIQGQTATGKSALSIKLAQKFKTEIINFDSMQVYKLLNIGTSKITQEQRSSVPHHLLDVVMPDEEYDASRFARDAKPLISEITLRGKTPILVGGTGLYIKCLLGGLFNFDFDTSAEREELKSRIEKEGLDTLYNELMEIDPAAALKIKPQDKQRVMRALEVYMASGIKLSSLQQKHGFKDDNYICLKIGLRLEKTELLDNIKKRTYQMFHNGLAQEVESLLNKGYKGTLKTLNSIGYRETLDLISGKLTLEEAKEKTFKRTRDYAKRQMTWFKQDMEIKWFHPRREFRSIITEITRFIRN